MVQESSRSPEAVVREIIARRERIKKRTMTERRRLYKEAVAVGD